MSSVFSDFEIAALKRLIKKGKEYWYIGSLEEHRVTECPSFLECLQKTATRAQSGLGDDVGQVGNAEEEDCCLEPATDCRIHTSRK